jgi:hypothetical protein
MTLTKPFYSEYALSLNRARLKHIMALKIPLRGLKILEPGCGVGLLTGLFEYYGCKIISTEAKLTNIEENLLLHPWREIYQADVLDPEGHKRFSPIDLILCYGLLYHVSDPFLALNNLALTNANIILIEAHITDAPGEQLLPHPESSADDQSAANLGCRPTVDYLKAILRESGWEYVYRPLQPDHPDFQWTKGIGLTSVINTRVMLIAGKNDLSRYDL